MTRPLRRQPHVLKGSGRTTGTILCPDPSSSDLRGFVYTPPSIGFQSTTEFKEDISCVPVTSLDRTSDRTGPSFKYPTSHFDGSRSPESLDVGSHTHTPPPPPRPPDLYRPVSRRSGKVPVVRKSDLSSVLTSVTTRDLLPPQGLPVSSKVRRGGNHPYATPDLEPGTWNQKYTKSGPLPLPYTGEGFREVPCDLDS